MLRLIIARHLGGVNEKNDIFLDFRPNERSIKIVDIARVLDESAYKNKLARPKKTSIEANSRRSERVLAESFTEVMPEADAEALRHAFQNS